MKIGLAQIKPTKGDIKENIKKHLKFINDAVHFKVDAIFFPELSLTGYEPKLAESLHMTVEDRRMDKFQEICDSGNITVSLGFPRKVHRYTEISMLIFQPNIPRQSYSKQYLHTDEIPYFVGGKEQLLLKMLIKG